MVMSMMTSEPSNTKPVLHLILIVLSVRQLADNETMQTSFSPIHLPRFYSGGNIMMWRAIIISFPVFLSLLVPRPACRLLHLQPETHRHRHRHRPVPKPKLFFLLPLPPSQWRRTHPTKYSIRTNIGGAPPNFRHPLYRHHHRLY